MDTKQEISLKIIEGQINDLMDSDIVSDLMNDPNQLTTFSLEWTDGIARYLHYRDWFTPEENARILEGFAIVKPIAEKLKLTWYE
ncbi:MAG: hypothetical protein HPY45_08315 [Anaerolineae bacterium]|nr:hypothetical protein [Anaerolineae bacterium]